jgi:hypothetical protein
MVTPSCWIGLDWIGLDWIGLDWIGLDWIGLDWIGLDWIWIGLDWIGLDWIGLDWIGLDWIGLDWIDLPFECTVYGGNAMCRMREKETPGVVIKYLPGGQKTHPRGKSFSPRGCKKTPPLVWDGIYIPPSNQK